MRLYKYMQEEYEGSRMYARDNYSIFSNPSSSEMATIYKETTKSRFQGSVRFIISRHDLFVFSGVICHYEALKSIDVDYDDVMILGTGELIGGKIKVNTAKAGPEYSGLFINSYSPLNQYYKYFTNLREWENAKKIVKISDREAFLRLLKENNKYIQEKYYSSMKFAGDYFEIFENPSPSEMRELRMNLLKTYHNTDCRFIAHLPSKTIYVFSGELLHEYARHIITRPMIPGPDELKGGGIIQPDAKIKVLFPNTWESYPPMKEKWSFLKKYMAN